MIPRFVALLLASVSVAACTTNSGVETTPTFSAARYVPPVMKQPRVGASAQPQAARPAPVPAPVVPASTGPVLSGAKAIASANRSATLEPDSRSMHGAAWLIDQHDPTRVYRVTTAPGRVTTILLPPGERFNAAVGGSVDDYLINPSYAGARPAISVLPRSAKAKGNMQLITTGGIYLFELDVAKGAALNLVDIGREAETPAQVQGALPQPQGDFTPLAIEPAGDGPVPAWAPVEAWADSYKMVVRFQGPVPVLPQLRAGQKGEQLVTYRTEQVGPDLVLLTSRRVTEAELVLDQERVRLTVDPAAVASRAAVPAGQGWGTAEPVEPVAPQTGTAPVVLTPIPSINVVVAPQQQAETVPARDFRSPFRGVPVPASVAVSREAWL